MLDRIESPETVLAFRAVGTIDRLDYERVLRPAVAEMVATQGEARFVYELGPEYERYAMRAAWEPTCELLLASVRARFFFASLAIA